MGLGIPPLKIKIVLESNPLKSSMLVGILGVVIGEVTGVCKPGGIHCVTVAPPCDDDSLCLTVM